MRYFQAALLLSVLPALGQAACFRSGDSCTSGEGCIALKGNTGGICPSDMETRQGSCEFFDAGGRTTGLASQAISVNCICCDIEPSPVVPARRRARATGSA